MLPVVPGHPDVTIGGAISSNIHGKNSFIYSTFSKHINWIKLNDGKKIKFLSKKKNQKLFKVTASGIYGLTGLIEEANINVVDLPNERVIEKRQSSRGLKNIKKYFSKNKNKSDYMICRITNLSEQEFIFFNYNYSKKFGSIKKFNFSIIDNKIIIYFLSFFFQYDLVTKIINKFEFLKSKFFNLKNMHINDCLFPYLKIKNYNHLFGKTGFYQMQSFIPEENFDKFLKNLSTLFSDNFIVPVLITIKKIKKNNYSLYLSKIKNGYTISIDIKKKDGKLINKKYYEVVKKNSGTIYLAKDDLVNKKILKNFIHFQDIEKKLNKYNINLTKKSEIFI